MPELLLEVGCEELPATSVERAFGDLRQAILTRLTDARLSYDDAAAMGTPRRLIVSVSGIPAQQEDEVKEVRGPSIQAAFDAEGQPTKALLGFCRGQGVEASEVRQEGEYVWVTKHVPGRPTRDILAEILPEAIRGLTFDKTMRWGSSRMRFARPIRWILAAFDGEVAPFEVEGITSGLTSRGHRFNAPGEFSATTFDDLMRELRSRQVEPDPDVRRERICEGVVAVADGTPDLPPALVDENVYLCEWPTALQGEFLADFLELPECVLVTAMAKHERVFPVRDANGRLMHRFVAIRNGGEESTVREGYAWVLNARLNDAKFFYDQDAKLSMDDFLEKTSGIVFQEKLGTVRQRADRLAELAAYVAREFGLGQDVEKWAWEAGAFALADLSTGLVSELPALQGLIGAEYLARKGAHEAVCEAIRRQYSVDPNDLRNEGSPARNARHVARPTIDDTLVALVYALHMDKLVGYLGVGILPKGSSDPFALRRSATLLLGLHEVLLWRNAPQCLRRFDENSMTRVAMVALKAYQRQGGNLESESTLGRLEEVLRSRAEQEYVEYGYEVLDAALSVPWNADLLTTRLEVMRFLQQDHDLLQTTWRPINLLRGAQAKGLPIPDRVPHDDPFWSDLDSPSGTELLHVASGFQDLLREPLQSATPERIARFLRQSMANDINRYLDETMILVEDERIRNARLALVAMIANDILQLGDSTKIGIHAGGE